MEFNPIKRFKLHREFNKNYKRLQEIDKLLNELQLDFMAARDYVSTFRIVNTEKTLHDEHTGLLSRNTDILNQLYGGLKWACHIFLQNTLYNRVIKLKYFLEELEETE